jgi:hypothetical protein
VKRTIIAADGVTRPVTSTAGGRGAAQDGELPPAEAAERYQASDLPGDLPVALLGEVTVVPDHVVGR